MTDWYRTGKNISSHLRSKGHNITFTQKLSWLTFYLNDNFLFCTDLQILPEKEVEKILLEILKEKENVRTNSKN